MYEEIKKINGKTLPILNMPQIFCSYSVKEIEVIGETIKYVIKVIVQSMYTGEYEELDDIVIFDMKFEDKSYQKEFVIMSLERRLIPILIEKSELVKRNHIANIEMARLTYQSEMAMLMMRYNYNSQFYNTYYGVNAPLINNTNK